MTEYRVRATFTKVYTDRTYQRKTYTSYSDAQKALFDAVAYYAKYPYVDRIFIEKREVSPWESVSERC